MREAAHIVLRTSAKFAMPAIFLVSLYLALLADAGLAGGALMALGVGLYALVFGVNAARHAAPPRILRTLMALGALALIAAAAIEWRGYAPLPVWTGLGLCLAIGASGALAFLSLAGRAHALRDEDW